MLFGRTKTQMVSATDALPGRDTPVPVPATHLVTGAPLSPPFADGLATTIVGMGCFWGAERLFWQLDGVVSTAVGYAGGHTPHPSYEEVCTGRTGHAEVVLVVFDAAVISYAEILRTFWEGHDPTQGMRQGNDVGTQYRSAIYAANGTQQAEAERSRLRFAERLKEAGHGGITTEITLAPTFYYAEEHHQQYLAKNPGGYCGLAGTGVSCPVGLETAEGTG